MSTNTNNPKPTLEERQAFFKLCKGHDWYYEYADDGHSYQKGRNQRTKLRDMAALHEDYREIFTSWCEYIRSGHHTNTEKKPKPIMPEV